MHEQFEAFRHREITLVGKRQPLQWCQNLRFLDSDTSRETTHTTTKLPKLKHKYSGHYVKTPKKYIHHNQQLPYHHQPQQQRNDDNFLAAHNKKKSIPSQLSLPSSARIASADAELKFDDKYVDSKTLQSSDYKKSKYNNNNDELKITYEKLWPKQIRNQNSLKKIFENHKLVEQPKNLIALASFPGSGNTWLRYLLQQATGIYTGSVYKDFGLLKSGFPAENIFNSSVSLFI